MSRVKYLQYRKVTMKKLSKIYCFRNKINIEFYYSVIFNYWILLYKQTIENDKDEVKLKIDILTIYLRMLIEKGKE